MRQFIVSKNLWDEFMTFKKAKEDAMTGFQFDFDISLGDGDGDCSETVTMTIEEIKNFRKYFEAPEWGEEIVEVCEIEHEFIPGASIYSDMLRKTFQEAESKIEKEIICGTKDPGSFASYNVTVTKCDSSGSWAKPNYFLDEETFPLESARDLDTRGMFDFLRDIYFRYVMPYVTEVKFVKPSALGMYHFYVH